MKFSHILEQAGFSAKEATVYTTLLELGASSVVTIAKKSGLKRPTVYLVLDELMKNGFVSEVPQEKRKRYIALSPERIIESLDSRTRSLRKMLPDLLDFYQGQSERPVVRFFSSMEGMMSVYREITRKGSAKDILAFVAPEIVPEEFDENWELFLSLFKVGNVRGRELFSLSSLDHPYVKQVQKIPNYEARISPSGMMFASDTVVYGNKVAMFSFKKQFALIIESEDIASSLRTLFDLAWQSARAL